MLNPSLKLLYYVCETSALVLVRNPIAGTKTNQMLWRKNWICFAVLVQQSVNRYRRESRIASRWHLIEAFVINQWEVERNSLINKSYRLNIPRQRGKSCLYSWIICYQGKHSYIQWHRSLKFVLNICSPLRRLIRTRFFRHARMRMRFVWENREDKSETGEAELPFELRNRFVIKISLEVKNGKGEREREWPRAAWRLRGFQKCAKSFVDKSSWISLKNLLWPFAGEQFHHDPQFRGPLAKRSCTDVICLLFFFVFLIAFGFAGYYGEISARSTPQSVLK